MCHNWQYRYCGRSQSVFLVTDFSRRMVTRGRFLFGMAAKLRYFRTRLPMAVYMFDLDEKTVRYWVKVFLCLTFFCLPLFNVALQLPHLVLICRCMPSYASHLAISLLWKVTVSFPGNRYLTGEWSLEGDFSLGMAAKVLTFGTRLQRYRQL